MSGKVSSRTNTEETDPACCEEFQIFGNDFDKLTSDVSKFQPYNLLEITNLAQDRKTSEDLCLEWLISEFPSQNWRKDSALFEQLLNQSGYCELFDKKFQSQHILLFTNQLENNGVLMMEIIFKNQTKLSFFHLVASLSDMCRSSAYWRVISPEAYF